MSIFIFQRIGQAVPTRSITFIRISVYVNKSIAQIILAVKYSLTKLFGSCVRELRLGTGLSQVEFGEMCGFYQTYLSRIENGKANPTLNAMEVIANALGMSVFELFEKVKVHKPPKPVKPLKPKQSK
jgi:ribosome-binding protein aMBF1 (putative translation factor)